MSGYIFHCTPCGNAHAGECPPKAPPATAALGPGEHDWEKLAVVDLSLRQRCRKCGAFHRQGIYSAIGGVDAPPKTGCSWSYFQGPR